MNSGETLTSGIKTEAQEAPDVGADVPIRPGSSWRIWISRSSWTLADQGFYALANFAVNILLARWLGRAEYGFFTIAYSVFLLFGTIHSGLLAEPMLVFASRRFAGDRTAYLGSLVAGHLWFSVALALASLAAAAGAWAFGETILAACLTALSLAGPLILLFWLFRRAALAYLQPTLAALGSAGYLLITLGGLYLLDRLDWLTPVGAIVLMGGASAAAAAWLMTKIRVGWATRPLMREAMIEHWGYGRWSIATGLLTWVPSYIYYLVLPAASGPQASAELKALTNLAMPALQMAASLGLMLVPAFAAAADNRTLHRLARSMLALFGLAGVCYALAIGLFRVPLLEMFYGGRYDQLGALVWFAGLLALPAALSTVATAALRAIQRPDRVFRAYSISTLVVALGGVPATFLWGLTGAIVSMVSSSACLAATLLWQLRGSRT